MHAELLEVLRFEREDLAERAPVRDRPPLGRRSSLSHRLSPEDPALGLPPRPGAHPGGAHRTHRAATANGSASAAGSSSTASAPARRTPSACRLRAAAAGAAGALALPRWPPCAEDPHSVYRPEANARGGQASPTSRWSGFTATLDPRRLRRAGRWRDGCWELYITVRTGGCGGAQELFSFAPARPAARRRAAGAGPGARPRPRRPSARAGRRRGAHAAGRRSERRARRRQARARPASCTAAARRARSSSCASSRAPARLRYAIERTRRRLHARGVPLGDARRRRPRQTPTTEADDADEDELGEPAVGALRAPAATADPRPAARRRARAAVELGRPRGRLVAHGQGDAALVVARRARQLRGRAGGATGARARRDGCPARRRDASWCCSRVANSSQHHPFDFGRRRGRALRGGSRARRRDRRRWPATLPLPEGRWRLCVRLGGDPARRAGPFVLEPASCRRGSRSRRVVDHKPFTLGLTANGDAGLVVRRDHDEDERGRYQERVLRRVAYAAAEREPLLDTVVYTSFRGRQYSDSPARDPRGARPPRRAAGAPLGRARRRLSRAGRRRGSCATAAASTTRCWRGRATSSPTTTSPTGSSAGPTRVRADLARHAAEEARLRRLAAARASRASSSDGWDAQLRNWQYVVSPNRFSTPILQRAYELEAEMLETGYPRVDVLAGAGP